MELKLSRREREVMDLVLAAGEATAEEVRKKLSGSPSSSTVRTILRRLEEKGFLKHKEEGLRYVYRLAVSARRARKSAIQRLVDVFYQGSLAKAVAGLVDASQHGVTDEDLDAIEEIIAEARAQTGKRKKNK